MAKEIKTVAGTNIAAIANQLYLLLESIPHFYLDRLLDRETESYLAEIIAQV